jgi:endonuclease/exonuclease/phosphatase family metal-dependent hydrolase
MNDQSLKFISLNIEGDKHLPLVTDFFKSANSDVILVQEIFKHTTEFLADLLQMEYVFVPTCTRAINYGEGESYEWGVAIFSKYTFKEQKVEYYAIDEGDKIPEYKRDANGRSIVFPSRVLLFVVIEKNGVRYHIANTHFTWTPDGKSSEQQHRDLTHLLEVLKDKNNLIMAGDFNAPRGGDIHKILYESFHYWIPPEVSSTLDPKLHRVKGLEYVVDHLFTRGNYVAEHVHVVEGVSDHKAIVAEILNRTLGLDAISELDHTTASV